MLPSCLNLLIEHALNCLEQIEGDSNYVINMEHWHTPTKGKCHVGLAGAVMAVSLSIMPDVICKPYELPECDQLLALASLRLGEIGRAYEDLGRLRPDNVTALMYVPNYADNPALFKAKLEEIANLIQECQ